MIDDDFSTRYGYIPGRCNAYKHAEGHRHELCRAYPRKGFTRCSRHSGGWYPGGGRDFTRPPKKEPKKYIPRIKQKFNRFAKRPKPVKVPRPPKVKSPYKPYSELFAWKDKHRWKPRKWVIEEIDIAQSQNVVFTRSIKYLTLIIDISSAASSRRSESLSGSFCWTLLRWGILRRISARFLRR